MRVNAPRLLAVLDPEVARSRRQVHASPGSARSSGGSRISGTSATLAAHAGTTAETARGAGGRAANSAALVAGPDSEECGPFDLLHTEKGFIAFEQWYRRVLASSVASNAVTSPRLELGLLWPQVHCPPTGLHEHAFFEVLRAFGEFSDGEALDFFDLLDHERVGFLCLPQVYFAMCLVAAVGCKQLTKFVYFHSTKLFDMLEKGCRFSAAPKHVTWAKVMSLLRLLGTPGSLISKTCTENRMVPVSQLTYDDFVIVTFPIMVQLDRGTDARQIMVMTESDRRVVVNSKMCTIL